MIVDILGLFGCSTTSELFSSNLSFPDLRAIGQISLVFKVLVTIRHSSYFMQFCFLLAFMFIVLFSTCLISQPIWENSCFLFIEYSLKIYFLAFRFGKFLIYCLLLMSLFCWAHNSELAVLSQILMILLHWFFGFEKLASIVTVLSFSEICPSFLTAFKIKSSML